MNFASKHISTVIWDLGGVLVDWDPRYLYRKIFRTNQAMEYFLTHICTSDWNEEQDAGRTFEEGTNYLTSLYPQYTSEIKLFYSKWEEMLSGPIHESVQILNTLKDNGNLKLYALTNWSAESFPIARRRFEFLQFFEGILVSGEEKLKKPDPDIFKLILNRYRINLDTAIFIDDNKRNIVAAEAIGLTSIHFQNPTQLRNDLESSGVL